MTGIALHGFDIAAVQLELVCNAVGVSEYDPIQLVEKTHGRMAEDHKWLKIT